MMKKAIIAMTFVLAVALVTGCGRSSERTVTTKEGTVTVKTEESAGGKGTVEVKTKEGTATITTETKKTITEAELGVPVYPGATVEASATYQGMEGSGTSKMQHNNLVTTDSFDKVDSFYKSNLKKVKSSVNNTQGDQQMSMYVLGTDAAPITVTISAEKGENKTNIMVMKAQK